MEHSPGPITVLYVDEDADGSPLDEAFPRRGGERFDVVTATSEAEGLEYLEDGEVDCVVSEYDLPDRDGVDFLAAVRREHGDLPFVLFTGEGSEAVASEAISAGVTDYVRREPGSESRELLANRCLNAVRKHRAETRSADLERIRRVSRAVDRALLRAEDREDLERRVCAAIAEFEPYRFVWIGVHDEGSERVIPCRSAGTGGHYLDDIEVTTDGSATSQGPTGRAVATGEIQVEQDIAGTPAYEPWRAAALERGYRSSAAVPFTYGDGRLGVLNVYADRAHTFDEADRTLLAELGGDISQALEALSTRQELRRTSARLEALFEGSPNMVDIHDAGGRIIAANARFHEKLGYEEGALVGSHVWDVDASIDAAEATAIWDGMSPGDRYEVEGRYRRRDGTTFPVEVHLQRLDVDGDDRFVVISRDVSERKRRERERVQVIERVTDAIVQVDEDWRFTLVDDRAEELYGMAEADLLGENFWAVFDEAVGTRFEEEYRSVMETREPTSFEAYYDGLEGWFDIQVYPDDDGGVSFYFRETSERRERQQALAEERERFRALARSATDAIVIANADDEIVFANDAVERVFGRPPAALEGAPVTTLIPPRFRDDHREAFGQVVATGERSLDWRNVRFPGLHADGHEVPLELSFATYQGQGERLVAAIVRDITQREELEAALREEKELLERVFDTSPVGITVIGRDGEIERANDTAEEVLGLERSEILSRTYDAPEWEVFDEDGEPIPTAELPVARVLRTGEPVVGYRHGVVTEGTERWLSVNAAPLTDGGGEVTNVVAVFQDITDRVAYERELERYETIVRTTSDPIFLLDDECRFTQVNGALAELTGVPADDLLGSHLSTVADEPSVELVEERIEEALEAGSDRTTFGTSLRAADGRFRQFATSMAVLDTENRATLAICIAHDVTELREHQARLSVLDRVLRHNLRNKLNVVAGHADTLSRADDPAVRERATTILETARSLVELSDSARQFESVVGGGGFPTEPLDVADVVRGVVEEARQAHPDATVRLGEVEAATVPGHPTLELALDELVTNALVHSDVDGPTVDVSVAVRGETVEVRVADEGPGLDDLDRRALMRGVESPMEHTQGLGLWLVRWTIERLGGDIEIDEREPRGTEITVALPVESA